MELRSKAKQTRNQNLPFITMSNKQTRRVQGRPLNCCTPNCQADAHSHGHQLPGMEGGHQNPAVRTWMTNRSLPALRPKQGRSKAGTLPTALASLAGHSPHHSGELPVPDETFALRRQWQMLGTNLQPLRAQKRPVQFVRDLTSSFYQLSMVRTGLGLKQFANRVVTDYQQIIDMG